MTLDEFLDATTRLCGLYGKTLNETQLDFWYSCLKNYDVVKYRRAIGEYAKKNRFMPQISDIIGEIIRLKPIPENKPQEEYHVKCERCNGRGLVKYYKDFGDYKYEYLCRCRCLNGKNYENMPFLAYDDVFHNVCNVLEKTKPLDIELDQINF